MVPVVIGGIVIAPGDWVVADDDGVIVIRPQEVAAVLAKAQTAAQIEQRVKELLSQGARVNDAVRQASSEIQARQGERRTQ